MSCPSPPPAKPIPDDPKVRSAILTLLQDGNHLPTAAAHAGVSESALYEWIQKGREAQALADQGVDIDERQALYAGFAESLQRARARAEVGAVGVIQKVVVGGYVVGGRETGNPSDTLNAPLQG